MSSILDALAEEQRTLDPEEQTQLNEALARVPQGRLREAVTNAIKRVPSEEFYAHTEPAVNGTDPFGSLAKADLTRVVASVLGVLTSKGVTPAQVAQRTGAATSDPKYVTSDDMARIAQWLQQEHPDVIGQVAEQYQANPKILQVLLGNKALATAVAEVGADRR
jgi:hypothetical protein